VPLPRAPEVRWGIGISLEAAFGRDGGRVEVASAGCDFLG
jgi:hypothetical protein